MKTIIKTVLASAVFVALSQMPFNSLAFEEKDEEEKEEPTLAESLKEKAAFEGFLDIYRDKEDGSGLIILEADDLNTPIIYSASTADGVVAAGTFRGDYRETKLLEFRRHYNRIDVVQKVNSFYFDPENPISKASHANTSDSVLASVEIAQEEDGKIAISLQELLKNESLHRVSPMPPSNPKDSDRAFSLGGLSEDKSRISKISNFPENTHVVVDYVFENSTPKVFGGSEIADQRYTTISLQHAFVKAPDNDYTPRRDDPRIGYFTNQVDDLTSASVVNYKDVIRRWDLQKKNPDADISDPVKPITWWIENTTPLEWRETITNAALSWNSSFEKAGISNAIEVKVQPDDATWSADDTRYNVLRWTSSPNPPFGGYGPAVAHPITGEIIAADIMLEYSFMQGRWLAEQVFTDGNQAHSNQLLSKKHEGGDKLVCSLGHAMSMNLQFAKVAGKLSELDDIENNTFLRQNMHYLIIHEIGHTLGLNHNMMATQLHGHREVHDASKTKGILAGSIMDYPAVNFAPVGMEQGDYFSEKPGPYDDWAIEYGYSQALADADKEEDRLNSILNRSTEPELAFGNDADDMRSPGRHVDPRINIFDMSSDAVSYAQDRFELIKSVSTDLKDKTLKEGQSHQELLSGFNILFREMFSQSQVVSRYVGGVYLNRAMVGQDGYTQPLTPVPADYQRKAMSTLNTFFFAADAVEHLEPLYAFLQRQRRGFSGWGQDESPKIHDLLLGAQKRVLDHLLHPNVTMRITDTALFGNEYPLNVMMKELSNGIFESDIKKDVNSYRQNLQVEYVERLIAASGLESNSGYDTITQATATYELKRIQDMADNSRGNSASKIHKQYIVDRINRAFHKSQA